VSTLEILSTLFAVAALFGGISARWLRLPITVGAMLLTVLASAALMAASGFLPGVHEWAGALVREIDFGPLVLNGMLPLLLFAGAFLLDLEHLAREKFAVSLLAIVGTLASFLLVAALLALCSGGRLPWMQCLLFGAIVSPTDPIAVLEMLRRVGAPKAIQAQLAGESLFNDGVGAVIFLTLLAIAQRQSAAPWQTAALAVVEAVGGVALGVVAALLASWLMRRVDSYQVDILFTLALAAGGYALAGRLHVSGPLEAVAAGITLRYYNTLRPEGRIAHRQIDRFWEVIDEIQNSILFVLLGLEAIAISLDAQTARLGLTAIVLVNAVRFAVVFLLLKFIRIFVRGHQSSVLIQGWGGLRGGLSIALALSAPVALGRSWIVGATYIVVVFSIVVQGASMKWMLRRMNRANAAD
jgi:CPA1 family monovalent cation:H+ antiporter